MLAASQAPIIMMSQNRQAAKDRFEARLDHETNRRSKAEIAGQYAKIDAVSADIERLVALQLGAMGRREDVVEVRSDRPKADGWQS